MTDHSCPDSCKLCYVQNCSIVLWLPCADCMRVFKSRECFDRHKQTVGNAKSICASLVKCFHCHTVVKRGRFRRHHCGLTRCSTSTPRIISVTYNLRKRNDTVSEDTDLLDTETDQNDSPKRFYCFLILSVARRTITTNPICA